MKNQSTESLVFVSLTFLASIGVFFLMLQHPATVGMQQNLLLACLAAVVFLEMLSPLLPRFGSLSASIGIYTFLLLRVGVEASVLMAFAATGLRMLIRDRGPWLLRLFSPFERSLSVSIAGILFSYFSEAPIAKIGVVDVFLTAAALFVINAFLEGMAAGLTLLSEEQRTWFKIRYRTFPLSFVAALLGGLAIFFYPENLPAAFLILLSLFALQFAMGILIKLEVRGEVKVPAMQYFEKVQTERNTFAKQSETLRIQLEQKSFELNTLLEFGQKIGAILTLDHAFAVVLEILKKLFHYQSCIVFFAETSAGEIKFRSKRSSSPWVETYQILDVKLGENIVGVSARDGSGYLVDSWRYREPGLLFENERSAMAVPLIVGQQVQGVLYVGSANEGSFTEGDLQLLTTLAYQVAIVLLYAESYESTVKMATTDGLTSLYTHRYFQERLSEEVRRSERYHQPLSFILLDLDNFKTYNDTLGHTEGDELLKSTSQILKECTRENDVVCRYGGDEFAILLLETTKETALSIASRIREALDKRLNSVPGVRVTASLGVASFPEDASTKADLFLQADKALYQSKNSGRNRVIAAARHAG